MKRTFEEAVAPKQRRMAALLGVVDPLYIVGLSTPIAASTQESTDDQEADQGTGTEGSHRGRT